MGKRTYRKLVSCMLAVFALILGSTPSVLASSGGKGISASEQNALADGDTIDLSKKGSVTIHKYDMTAAQKDGVMIENLGLSTGEANPSAEDSMLQYAVEGVEFSYLYCGAVETWHYQKGLENQVEVVYEVPEELAHLIGLDPMLSFDMKNNVAYPCEKEHVYHFSSEQINEALKQFLTGENEQSGDRKNMLAKDALEEYIRKNKQTETMALTDANGVTEAADLELGLYLIVETKVPEYVVETVNPWFVSLPFTDHKGDTWKYDIQCYPKNQSGNPTLEKLVRQSDASADPSIAEHTASDSGDVSDARTNINAFDETAAASEGDTLDYILVSRLPHIHSTATYLTKYTFLDTLSEGITYNKDARIAFFTSQEAAQSCDLAQAADLWDDTDGYYEQKYAAAKADAVVGANASEMEISFTEAGLKHLNQEKGDFWMVVYYTAVLNSDATAVLGESGNPNEVTLEWRRTSDTYYDTLRDDCTVYTFGIHLDKQFSDGRGDAKKVQFVLYNVSDHCYLQAEDAAEADAKKTYYISGKTADQQRAAVFTPDSDGSFYVNGLEKDEYQLTEIATDETYQLLKKPVSLTIDEDTVNAKDGYLSLSVTNHRKLILPQTGGSGMNLAAFSGVFIVAAGCYLIRKMSRKHGTGQDRA